MPISQDARGFQSWLRFFVNIPGPALRSLEGASAHLRKTFAGVSLLAKTTDETMVFFPRDLTLSPEAIAEMVMAAATPGSLSFILPQWLSIKEGEAQEKNAVVMVCAVFRRFDAAIKATVHSFLKTTATASGVRATWSSNI